MFDYRKECEGNILGKPSIFSSEYEKKMRKRKRNIIILTLAIILVVGSIAAKLIYNPINTSKVKQNLQAWVDSDTQAGQSVKENDKTQEQEVQKQEEVKKEEIKEQSIDISLVSGKVAKAIFTTENSTNIFTEIRDLDEGVTYDISPSKNKVVIADTDGTMTVYSVDGTSTVVSKDQYVSSQGTAFIKSDVLAQNPGYLWNSNPKFIDDNRIIFITNRPYFGFENLDQYLWITDIASGNDNVLWNIKGSNITLGESSESKIPASIDGVTYHIDGDGNYSN